MDEIKKSNQLRLAITFPVKSNTTAIVFFDISCFRGRNYEKEFKKQHFSYYIFG
jgi:hypothetical protein